MIGDRIKQARTATGMSMRVLAELAGISAMAISKYENNQSTPSSTVLLALAKGLDVRTEYFFRRVDVELEEVEYRTHPGLPNKEKRRILADAREQVERWLELEEFIPTPWSKPFEVPKTISDQVIQFDQIEDVATQLRQTWNLGLNPIADLIDTLESRGIKVFATDYRGPKKFDGLAAKADGMPVVVLNKDSPGDRQRFTLAHELGHLVLHGRLSDELEKEEEKACHRFAGAFLAPKDKVFQVLGDRRSWLEPQELMLLKFEFGLSMGAWTFRARDLGILPQSRMSELWKLFRANGWNDREPNPQYAQEQPRLFKQLVYRALAEDLIGETKAAELLGYSLATLRSCRNMECPHDTDYQ